MRPAVYASLAPRLHFEQGDAFELRFEAQQFDLVVCRHVTQSIPEPEKVLGELLRICKPGGWLHVLSEDYGMLQMMAREIDPTDCGTRAQSPLDVTPEWTRALAAVPGLC